MKKCIIKNKCIYECLTNYKYVSYYNTIRYDNIIVCFMYHIKKNCIAISLKFIIFTDRALFCSMSNRI
jgi:hypothetical protein